VRVGIAVGSNLGDRWNFLRRAREMILALPGVTPDGALCAPVYETVPIDCPPGAGPFLNTVMEIGSTASPGDLLSALRGIEIALGRPSRYPRHAPRPIDLDILYAGGVILHTPDLTLPHPRLHERRFVLEPLAAIRPELVLPGQVKSVAELLDDLGAAPEAVLAARKW
jgi:2-amino-4-hydroxy-6-hydroxymethyldihydropteridine diphosphokinase